MPRTPRARNWKVEEIEQLMELVFVQREYLRPILRRHMINRIWGGIAQEFGNEWSVSQLKNKWATICSACGNNETSIDAANLPQGVKDKMRLIQGEEAKIADDSDSADEGDGADDSQSSSAENGDPTAQDNTPASPSIAGGSNSSNPDEQNQTERQHNLDSEEQNQDDIENLPEMKNLRL